MMPIYPHEFSILTKPRELATGEVVNGEFQAFEHLVLRSKFSAQQATDETILQTKGVKTFVAETLRQQVAHFLHHALRYTFINTLINAGVEFGARPVQSELQVGIARFTDAPLC